MEKILCFHISGVDLFLEQTLVEYNNMPIFFVCSDTNNRYLILCTDVSEYSYVITQITIDDLYSMLIGKLSMRDSFLNCPIYWEVFSGEDIDSDIVQKNGISYLKEELLPEKDAVFQILDSEVAAYLEKIRAELYNADEFSKIIQSEQSVTEEGILLTRDIEQYTNIVIKNIHQTIIADVVLSKAVYDEDMQDWSTTDIQQSINTGINLYNLAEAA